MVRASCLLLSVALCACQRGAEMARPSRLLLVSLDTVRADRVTGPAARAVAPELARLAAESAVVAPFYAASNYTLPSHVSILSGLDAAEHGVVIGGAAVSPEVPMLAERLGRAGFATASFNEGGYVSERYGFARGFDRHESLGFNQLPGAGLGGVLAWIEEHQHQPWFLFVHSYAAHAPYGGYARYRETDPGRGLLSATEVAALRSQYPRGTGRGRSRVHVPREVREACSLYNELAERPRDQLACASRHFAEEFPDTEDFVRDLDAIRRSYDARIGRLDTAIGELRRALERTGQWQETLVVITADHGEAFFEHGLYGHTYVPHEEVLRVPLIVSHPASIPPGRIPGPAWHLDLLPTVLDFLGLEIPAGLHGRSLRSEMLGRKPEAAAPAPPRTVFPVVLPSALRPHLPMRRTAVSGRWKWVRGHPHFGDAEGLLFDLVSDPGEATNQRLTQAAVRSALDTEARVFEADLELRSPVDARGRPVPRPGPLRQPAPRLSEEERESLRALGYLP